MMYNITSFEEGKFYVVLGQGKRWCDYDGPFDDIKQAVEHLVTLCCGDYSTPEVINSAVIGHFQNNSLGLVREDGGFPIDGKFLFWKKSIVVNEEIIHEWQYP